MPLEGPNWSPGPVSTCVQQVPVSSPAMILNHKSRTRADALALSVSGLFLSGHSVEPFRRRPDDNKKPGAKAGFSKVRV